MKLGMCIGGNVYNMQTQNLSRYLEGQGHNMILKQNRGRPIILLFEVELIYLRSHSASGHTNCQLHVEQDAAAPTANDKLGSLTYSVYSTDIREHFSMDGPVDLSLEKKLYSIFKL